MAQIGEFSFIIIGLGLTLNAIDEALFPIIVTVSLITTFTTPYLIRFSSYLIDRLDKNLSDSQKLALDSYSAMIFRGLSVISLVNFKFLALRLIINGMIIAIIFTLSYQFLLPWTSMLFGEKWLAKTICWLSALLLSSPFLWGMIFYSQDLKKLFPKKNLNLPFLTAATLAILEIILFSLLFFQTWLVILFLFVILTTIFLLTYPRLEKTYFWFEEQLKQNINNKNWQLKKYEELAPWDTYLVEVNVGNQSEFIEKKLKQSQIRKKFGINIIAIKRNQTVIFAPTGNDILLPHDKLIILGEEKQIEDLRKRIEEPPHPEKHIELLENIILKPIVIPQNSTLIKRTIRTSKIREKFHGIIVGLERNRRRILNPDPNTLLKPNDILYIAGEANYLDSIDIRYLSE